MKLIIYNKLLLKKLYIDCEQNDGIQAICVGHVLINSTEEVDIRERIIILHIHMDIKITQEYPS